MFSNRIARCGSIVVFLSLSGSLHAQESRATIIGRVTDTSGAVFPGAGVSFTNLDTAVVVRTQTNGEGNYLKVPDGNDYIELMLFKDALALDKRGTPHHMCLEVPDVAAAIARLEASPYRKHYTRPIESKTGINRKRQLNLFDPDGTRIELMEPVTVDGKPAPSSTAPPPH
jgi:hypothetical protein